MKHTYTPKDQNRKVQGLHNELKSWKSNIQLITDETLFMSHLLNSYVFQPNTHNLFECLQNYQHRLKKIKNTKTKLKKNISLHMSKLAGMMECTDQYCDLEHYQKHNVLKASVVDYCSTFRELKLEIFNYAAGILKKRKQVSNTQNLNQN